MAYITFAALALSICIQGALGWGLLGSETVGFVGQEFLAPKALQFVQSTLGAQYNFSLGPAATWADQVKTEPGFLWSAPLHFVNATDSAPLICNVEQERDCSNNFCILGAIANYTTRVNQTGLEPEQIQEALKFLGEFLSWISARFLGDIGQPLHVEARGNAGSTIPVICNGSNTNLHAIWETNIIRQHVNQSHGGTPQSYAAFLISQIVNGVFTPLVKSWLACTSTTEPVISSSTTSLGPTPTLSAKFGKRLNPPITPLECPLVWARESNAFDCTLVFNFTTGEDLCSGAYFTNAVPSIDLQVAKQGIRLAAWLNVIFDGAPLIPIVG